MNGHSIHDDDRSVSTAITHALTLGITAILVTALLLSTGNFLQSQQHAVAQRQLEDVGGNLASLVGEADRLNGTGENVSVTLSATYPSRIAGEPYTIALAPTSTDNRTATLYLNSSALDVSAEIAVATETPMRESRVRGGDPTVRLCPNGAGPQYVTLGGCS